MNHTLSPTGYLKANLILHHMNVLFWLQDPSVKFALLTVIAVHILLLIISALVIRRHKEKIDARDIQLWKGLAFAGPDPSLDL